MLLHIQWETFFQNEKTTSTVDYVVLNEKKHIYVRGWQARPSLYNKEAD